MTGRDPGESGDAALPATDPPSRPGPGQHLDQAVSRVVYDLRDAGVRDQAEAMHAIAAREGAGLNPGQIATVLWQFPPPPGPDGLRPVGPYYVPPGQRDPVGPDHPMHDEGDEDPPGVSWSPDGVDRWHADHPND